MMLWNSILPEVTTAKPVNYWQAMGLLVLCRILFGGIKTPGSARKFNGNRHKPGYWREKWETMTDEERTNMRKKWMGSDNDKNC